MTKEALFTAVEKAGLIPVPVRREGVGHEAFNYFDGGLEPFLVASKAIGASAIFVQDSPLEDWLFFYDPDEKDGEGDFDNEIDLARVHPALAKYKKYLGENYTFHLTAKGGASDLCLILDQSWVKDFEDEVERAQGMAVLARSSSRKKR